MKKAPQSAGLAFARGVAPDRVAGSGVGSYRRLLTYAWPYKWAFLLAVIGMAVLALTATGFAALMKPLMDEGFVNKDMAAIRRIPVLLVGLFVLRGVASFFATYMLTWVGRKVTLDLRNEMFAHLMDLPSTFYDANSSGGLVARLIFDVEQISRAVTQAVLVLIRDGLTVIALGIWLFYLNWRMTLLFAVLVPLSILLLRVMSRRFRKTSRQIQLTMGEISQVTQEATEGQKVVKAFGAQEREIAAFMDVNEKNRRYVMRKAAISAVGEPITQLLAAGALAVVIFMALHSGEVTAGGFTSYITGVALLMNPSKRLTKVNETIQAGIAAAGSIFGLVDAVAEPDTGTRTLENARGRIEFRNVQFRYPTASADALHDVSFTIEPGQRVALVGPSGSGKTTCASLLPRFYRVTGGEILLDGIAINDLVLNNLRGHLALVGQEAILFDDTIRNNIAYGKKGPIDETRLLEAARAAHVLEFIERLPEGMDTRVGEKGLRLSGGQRQRIAIARALYKNAPILILDEATSALDTESERYVQSAMQRLMENRTTLVIAHRLSTVEHADRIIVLSQGRVVEAGTHRELLARNGQYASLYRSQFSEAPSARASDGMA